MKESTKSKLMRWGFNLFPAFRRTGGRLVFISSQLDYVKVKIPLNWKTRNYVGSIFGGSMYAAIDPMYMIMFIKRLGSGYIVWDKAAEIDFIKPGKADLFAEFTLTNEKLEEVKSKLESGNKLLKTFRVELRDQNGNLSAVVNKTLYLRKKTDL